jgi:predicted nuclease of predicted toxin-antitoxin system
MRILLDECLPKKLKRLFPGHEVWTTAEKGWAGKKNGALLTVAQAEFDVLITVDQNLRFQQRVSQYEIGVIVLGAASNTLPALQPLVPAVLNALEQLRNGHVIQVGE